MMQDMDTLAPAPDDTSDLEVIFISTPNNNGLQVHREDFLLSKGGSAPVEVDDTASEDAEQDHSEEIEVIKAMVPQPTEPTAAEVVAAISTAEPPPPELPMTEEQFQKLKVDAVFACLDVRYNEGGMGKDVVRLPSNWDARRKAKLPTFKIRKRKTSTVCPKVGSTPTSSSRPHKAAPGSSSKLGSTPKRR